MSRSITALAHSAATRQCCLAMPEDAEYETYSRFIASVFRKAYDASVMVSYPTLVAICVQTGVQAALGLRSAAQETLFLERYLDSPAEQAIAERTGMVLPRCAIAEAGNLASTRLGALRDLMFMLSCLLREQGHSYILFTGTDSLKRYLEALGLKPLVYADANAARLGGEAESWGRYYDMQPRVMGGTTDEFYYGLLKAYHHIDA